MVEGQSNRSATAQKAKCPAGQSGPPVVSHHFPGSTLSSELAHPVANEGAGHCSQAECQGKQDGQQDVPLVRNTLTPTCTGRHPLIKSAPLSQNGIQRGPHQSTPLSFRHSVSYFCNMLKLFCRWFASTPAP